MRISRLPIRLLLISLLSLTTIAAAILGQTKADPALVVAAREGDFETVRALLAKRVNVNEQARDGATAILWAVHQSDLKMARALLAAGANVNTPNRYGVTPLLEASRTGDTPMIAELLKAGADAKESVHPEGETPLMGASRTGKLEAVGLLLKAGVNPNAADKYQKQTALMWAAEEGHVDVVNALLAAKADPNAKAHVSAMTTRKNADHATGGFTALMFAVRNGHENAVRALAKGGADLKAINGDGVTATSIAITNDRFDLARTCSISAPIQTTGRFTSPSTCTTRRPTCVPTTARVCAPIMPINSRRSTLSSCCSNVEPIPTSRLSARSTTSRCAAVPEQNSSPFFRAAIAADVEALKLMLKHGARVDWSPAEVKKKRRRTTPLPVVAGAG